MEANYSWISFSVFPLVSTRYLLLKITEAKLQIAKNKNKGIGVPNAFSRMGNKITTTDAAAQLERVENGIIWG